MFSLKFTEYMPEGVAAEFNSLYKGLNKLWLTQHNEDGTHITAQITTAVSEVIGLPIGTIQMYGGSSDPNASWLICDGRAVNRSTYSGLFSVISTTYGVGNGTTTFNLPDFRGKFPFGKATSGTGSSLGSTFGLVDHIHTGPAHTHTGPSHTHDTTVPITGYGTNSTPVSGSLLVSDGGALPVGTKVANTTPTVTSTASGTGATGSSGAGNTGTANPPGLVVNFIILAT